MTSETPVVTSNDTPARRPGNFGPRDKKSRFAKRPRIVWMNGKTVRGILEDMQLVYHQTSDKDSGVGQRWWRRLLRNNPAKFLEMMWKEEKRQLGYDEEAASQAAELEKANEQVSKLKAKVAELETNLREERAKMTAKLLEESRDVRQHRAVKMVEKLIDDFRLKTENERQLSVKIGQCISCGHKLSPKPSETDRIVEEPERRVSMVAPDPVIERRVDQAISKPEQRSEPVNMTDEDRPKWRAYIDKIRRKQRPLNLTPEEVGFYRKYGSPLIYIKDMKN